MRLHEWDGIFEIEESAEKSSVDNHASNIISQPKTP